MKLGNRIACLLALLFSFALTTKAQVTADAGPAKIHVCELDCVVIGGSPTGSGVGPFTYAWWPNVAISDTTVANPTIFANGARWYYVNVSNGSQNDIDSIFINVLPMPLVDAGPRTTVLCLGDTMTLGGAPTASQGSGPLTINWTPNFNISSTTAPNPSAWPNITTQYICAVNDSVCTRYDTIDITVVPYPVASAGSGFTMCDDDSVQIGGSPTASGGTGGPYVIRWTPIASVNNDTIANPYAQPTSTGYIKVNVSNLGCADEDSILVTVNPAPTLALNFNDTTICNNDSVQLGGSPTASGGVGTLNYTWTPAAGLNNASIPNPNARPAGNTTYNITVVDQNGCDDSDTVRVRLSTAPTADAGAATGSICFGDSVQIGGSPTASGGTAPLSIQWLPSAAVNNDSIANPYAMPATTTTIQLQVTDAYGCIGRDSIVMTVFPNPILSVTSSTGYCGPDSVDIGGNPTATSGTGPLGYAWSPAAGLNNPAIANPNARPAAPTTYTLVVTDSVGCSSTASVFVTSWLKPTANAGPAPSFICAGDSTIIGGSPTGIGGQGQLSFSWSPSAVSDTAVSNPFAKPLVSTLLTVTVSDTNGCSDTSSVFVGVNPVPNAVAGNDTALCLGDSAILGGAPTGSGGSGGPYTYLWNPPGGLAATTIPNPKAGPLSTIQYIVRVTDVLNCSNHDTVVVTVSAPPTANAGLSGSTICSNDSILLGGSPPGTGGLGPLSYSWSPTTNVTNPLLGNTYASPDTTFTYYLTITDSIGCSDMDSIFINVNIAPRFDTSNMVIIPATCDSANGAIMNINISGTPTFFYEWRDTSGTIIDPNPNLVGYMGGQYWFGARDGNNCSSQIGPIVIPQLTGPSANGSGVGVTNASCGLNNGAIAGMAFGGGNGPLTYQWWFNDTIFSDSLNLMDLDTGYYVFIVTDSIGCISTDTVLVNRTPLDTLIANWDYQITDQNVPTSVNVLFNDIGTPTNPQIIVPTANGSVSVSGASIQYTPDLDFSGFDTCWYRICNANCPFICDSALVLWEVVAPIPLDIPNAFTPNGDGWNDLFVIQGLKDDDLNSLVIFNRWGSVIYEAQPYQNDWDGTTNNGTMRLAGKRAVDGTYFYLFKQTTDSDPLRGSIELKTKK